MLKLIKNADLKECICDTLLIFNINDFPSEVQGVIPAIVWERLKKLEENPRWEPGMMALLKDDKKKAMHVALPANMQVIFANISDEQGIKYKYIDEVLGKLKEKAETLEAKSVACFLPGAGQDDILPTVVYGFFKKHFAEPNPGKGTYVEVHQRIASADVGSAS